MQQYNIILAHLIVTVIKFYLLVPNSSVASVSIVRFSGRPETLACMFPDLQVAAPFLLFEYINSTAILTY